MKFSEKTTDLLLDIKEFAQGKLRNDFELSFIIEHTLHSDKSKLFTDIIFKAKFLKGLLKVIQSSGQEEKEKLVTELTLNMQQLTADLLSIFSEDTLPVKEQFENKFFGLTSDCLMSFYSLIEDLAVCKDYFNSLKYNN